MGPSMRGFIIVVLLAWLGFVCYQQFNPQVYARFSDMQSDPGRGEKVLYFWVLNKHSELFQVGRTYQLIGKQHRAQLELSSVTYAQVQPDSVKLGFRLPLARDFQPEDEAYIVSLGAEGQLTAVQP